MPGMIKTLCVFCSSFHETVYLSNVSLSNLMLREMELFFLVVSQTVTIRKEVRIHSMQNGTRKKLVNSI